MGAINLSIMPVLLKKLPAARFKLFPAAANARRFHAGERDCWVYKIPCAVNLHESRLFVMRVRCAVLGKLGGKRDLRVVLADARGVLMHGEPEKLRFVRPLGEFVAVELRLLGGHGGADNVIHLLQGVGGVA